MNSNIAPNSSSVNSSRDNVNPIVVEILPSIRASASQVASATVRVETNLGQFVIHDARILKNKQGIAWFSLPAYSTQVGKQYTYHPSLELPANLLQEISAEALKAYAAWAA